MASRPLRWTRRRAKGGSLHWALPCVSAICSLAVAESFAPTLRHGYLTTSRCSLRVWTTMRLESTWLLNPPMWTTYSGQRLMRVLSVAERGTVFLFLSSFPSGAVWCVRACVSVVPRCVLAFCRRGALRRPLSLRLSLFIVFAPIGSGLLFPTVGDLRGW